MTADGGRVRPQDLLSVTVHRPGGEAEVLEVTGEVDLLSVQVLDDALAEALARGPALLVIDLTGVSFLASVGMTVLLKAHRQAGDATRLRVVAPARGTVGRALELTGLTDALGVTGTRADALAD
ncbi:STAS domain-containing protein [Amycolatopsis pretoriensis]|uniref:STAS domain-containing protein n=1 Tax=Amycolatopsis pretoriensis TaxID=218821 RepID=UPI001FCA1394|nr:STAS domain-containing protein [Amycolatopsis pretoriensis]